MRKRAFGFHALWIFILAIALCLPAMQAGAGPVLDRIQKNGVLVVGTDPTYPPLTAKATDGSLIGYEVDLIKVMAGLMKVKVQYKEIPFDKLLSAVEKNEIDLAVSGITMTPERNARVMFAGPHMVAGQSVILKKQMAINLQGPASLNKPDITVAAGKGTTGELAVKELLPKAKYIPVDSQEAALKLVLDGKADAAMADFPFCALSSFRYADKGIVTTEQAFTYEPLGIAMSGKDAQLHNLVHNYLQLIQGSGRMEEMQARWFKRADWIKQLPK
jgi:polar amino acid transport system substrate-binding protein